MVGVGLLLVLLLILGLGAWGWWCPYGDGLVTEKYVFANREHSLPPRYLDGRTVVESKPWVREELLRIFDKVHTLFVEKGIPYWMARSTLWGALLVRGLLPWEDKIELETEFSQEVLQQLVDLRSALHPHGLLLTKHRAGYRVHGANFSKFPFVQLTFLGRRGARLDACGPLDELNRCTFEAVTPTWHETEIYPLQSLPFEHVTASAPRAAEKCVRNLYGSDALQRAPNRGNVWWYNSLRDRLSEPSGG